MIDNPILFDDAFEMFLLAKRSENVVPGTLNVYGETAGYWRRRWGNGPLADIAAEHVRHWLVWLAGNVQDNIKPPNISGATVHIRFRNVRTFFKWCECEDLIARSPMRNIKPPIVEQLIPDILTEAEVVALLNGVKRNGDRHAFRDYCIHLAFLVTGVRLQELCGLNVDDLNLLQGFALVMGKGRKQRYVPLFEILPLELKRYMLRYRRTDNGERALFINDSGHRLEKRGIQSIVIRDLRQFVERDLNRRGPHTYRHTACTFLLRRLGDIKRVAEIMGHTTVRTTEGYTHLSPADLVRPMMNGMQFVSPIDELLKARKGKNGGQIRYTSTGSMLALKDGGGRDRIEIGEADAAHDTA